MSHETVTVRAARRAIRTMVHRSRLRRPVAGLASVPFAVALDRGCIRRPEASVIDEFLKHPVRDMQHMLRLHIQAGHVGTAGKTIDANDRVLPDGAARRRLRQRLGPHARCRSASAKRAAALPRFARNPVDLLVNIAPRPPQTGTD
ncbi:hypothetical protein HR51_00700 [Burkholderia cepacia]|nr:hypothetical protein HR51_00700 [Burkholderia cepacia]